VRPIVLALLMLGLMPTATAQTPLLFGTEELPELWGNGVVNYHPLNPGSTDHDYLAVNRSWFDVDPSGELLMLHLRVIDASNLETTPDWFLNCHLNATIAIDGTPTGDLVGWSFYYSNGKVTSNSTFVARVGAPDGSASTSDSRSIDATFRVRLGEPGYYEWTIRKFDLQAFGTELHDLAAGCGENYGPAGMSLYPFPNRSNPATSHSIYSLEENRRVAGPEGELDPIERFERENATATPSSTANASENGTPFLGWIGIVSALGAAMVGVQRARRR
jgi:hypothetical protein